AQAKPPVPTNKLGVPLKNLNSDGKRLTTRRISRHVVESYSVKHSKFVYMRSKFFEREERRWQRNYHHTSAMKALEQTGFKGFGKAIAKDIIEDNKSLKIQNKLAGWTAEGGKFVEWKATQPYLNDEGETVFAVSAEAQLFRWGAQASVATTFEPSKGKIDLGVGADASVSLAEAK
ncbi:peptidoglycan-binding protein, partial [Vibrio neptunius]|nr:peptidoglycan-binding protein [Vibrio neptunius]